MPVLGVSVAVLIDGQVLLTEREDFAVWCLPGGGVESGESVAQAAVREVQEETGLRVELTRLVGIYSQPRYAGGGHSVLFAARVVGGALALNPSEVRQARAFSGNSLPDNLMWWHRQKIADALNGVGGGVARAQDLISPFPPELTRAELYALRDSGELSPAQVFAWLCRHPGPDAERLEVGH
ncbi:MAG: NUDIX domain-containing protein [Chloroflexi bacterium]|nr:NUDIX domain-containing protein [Chloroflexota bacterium]MBI3733189.1 NUDIX domain-containing protein [Chloroflexota bacterium]